MIEIFSFCGTILVFVSIITLCYCIGLLITESEDIDFDGKLEITIIGGLAVIIIIVSIIGLNNIYESIYHILSQSLK